ncbi:hypothetical protein SAMD00023353_2100710 [Rosellinia necatrix]|uniref:Uncharacterized protein n=1 Tax=Rosellinia necatrix TaxID=77044 RepID=A0A1S8A7N0_ROSNE|nr:hypothetical protein SAMD00023353_2100710 [Rosellinia necatrix]
MVLRTQVALSLLYRDLNLGTATWDKVDKERETIKSWVAALIKVTTADQYTLSGCTWEQCLQGGSRYLRDILLNYREGIFSCPWLSSASRANKTLLDILLENLLPGAKHIGDQQVEAAYIVVILGSGVPFVPRSRQGPQRQPQDWVGSEKKRGQGFQSDYWHVVGESYVQGLMNGEAVEASRQGTFEEVILTLA